MSSVGAVAWAAVGGVLRVLRVVSWHIVWVFGAVGWCVGACLAVLSRAMCESAVSHGVVCWWVGGEEGKGASPGAPGLWRAPLVGCGSLYGLCVLAVVVVCMQVPCRPRLRRVAVNDGGAAGA